MKAITIWEPWASLIILGYKKFETRSWRTNVRGQIAIHASKRKMDEEGKKLAEKYGIVPQYGKVIGIVDLAECWECFDDDQDGMFKYINGMTEKKCTYRTFSENTIFMKIPDVEKELGHFAYGRYAWEMNVVEKFNKPIPAKGHQGIWNLK